MMKCVYCVCVCFLFIVSPVAAQHVGVSELHEQARLPRLMVSSDGEAITTEASWLQRRAEIKAMMLHYQYGAMPPRPDRVTAVDIQHREHECGTGNVESMTLVIESSKQLAPLRMRLLVFVPHSVRTKGPLPVIIREEGTLNGNAFVPRLFEHDYIFIEYARHDLDPDKKDVVGPAQRAYPEFDWATLSVWAWGGMRVVDYLESRSEVDMQRIGITGHSRGGKMALLAGALDERISLVVPVQSGAGGAGSYTMIGPGGESLAMNDKPHWYADRLRMFIGHAEKLPFDQHFLKALVAPRALLCIESVDDDYANPVGTQLTTIAAQPAFDIYGDKARDRNGVTYRNGGHSFSTEDWQTLLTFAEWHFRGREPENAEVYRSRPYDLPTSWYPEGDSQTLAKGIDSQKVPTNLGDLGLPGFAKIGNPGNKSAEDYFGMGKFGAVAYEYEIGNRQVTNAEYVEFLNAIFQRSTAKADLYDPDMAIQRHMKDGMASYSIASDQADLAVTHTKWCNGIRYCNWLHNGKPTGAIDDTTTEDGAYAISAAGVVAGRNSNARFALPSDDEWFKAAYYDPKQGYLLFETSERGGLQVVRHDLTAKSPYGTTGMFDRLWEWNENRVNGLFRSVRSGAWFVGNNRQAAGRLYAHPDLQLPNIGIRIVRLNAR